MLTKNGFYARAPQEYYSAKGLIPICISRAPNGNTGRLHKGRETCLCSRSMGALLQLPAKIYDICPENICHVSWLTSAI